MSWTPVIAAVAMPRRTSAATAKDRRGVAGSGGAAAMGVGTDEDAAAPATAAAGWGWATVTPFDSVVTTERAGEDGVSGTGVGTPGAMSAVARLDWRASRPPGSLVSAT